MVCLFLLPYLGFLFPVHPLLSDSAPFLFTTPHRGSSFSFFFFSSSLPPPYSPYLANFPPKETVTTVTNQTKRAKPAPSLLPLLCPLFFTFCSLQKHKAKQKNNKQYN